MAIQNNTQNNTLGALSQKKCIPCEGGTLPLPPHEYEILLSSLPEWSVVDDGQKIEKTYKWNTFGEAVSFINTVAKIAEEENHHPDINLFNYNKVKLTLSTHAIDGLSENDFIVAAKIESALNP